MTDVLIRYYHLILFACPLIIIATRTVVAPITYPYQTPGNSISYLKMKKIVKGNESRPWQVIEILSASISLRVICPSSVEVASIRENRRHK